MKILLVRPVSWLQYMELWCCLGLASLASAVRKEHSVEILDCPARGFTYKDFEHYIKKTSPDIVGFTEMFFTLPAVEKSAAIVKSINRQIITIAGGPSVTAEPLESLKFLSDIDFGIRGEGEFPLVKLTAALNNQSNDFSGIEGLVYRKSGGVIANKPFYMADLDKLPLPSWDIAGLENYPACGKFGKLGGRSFLPITVARGCLYKCHFCTTQNGVKVRLRNLDNVAEEIKTAHRIYGIDNFQIVDDNFAVNKQFVLEFCEKIMQLGFKVSWGAFHTRIECLDKEAIRAMDRAGCYYLTTGIETASQQALNGVDKEMNLELIKDKLCLIRDTSRIKVGGFFLVGLPGETKEDILATSRLSRQLPLECIWFTVARVEPGSQWYSALKANDSQAATFVKLIENNCLFPGVPFSFRQYQNFIRLAIIRFYSRPRAVVSFIRNLLNKKNKICILNLITIISFLFARDIHKDSKL